MTPRRIKRSLHDGDLHYGAYGTDAVCIPSLHAVVWLDGSRALSEDGMVHFNLWERFWLRLELEGWKLRNWNDWNG